MPMKRLSAAAGKQGLKLGFLDRSDTAKRRKGLFYEVRAQTYRWVAPKAK